MVDGGSVQRIAITSQYKEQKTITGEITTVLSQDRNGKVLVTPDSESTEYLVEAGDILQGAVETEVEIQGIKTSFERTWGRDDEGPYPVIRAVGFSVGPTDEMKITGPNFVSINYDIESADDYGIDADFTVNREIDTSLSGHSYSVTWASGSETLSTLTSSLTMGTDQSTINVQADWEDLWGNRVTELRELRPVDRDIGDDYYDGPLYREDEVFDFRRPNINVIGLRLKIEAEYEGQVRTKYVAVQIAPDYNDYYA